MNSLLTSKGTAMKKSMLLLCQFYIPFLGYSQYVGIGTTNPITPLTIQGNDVNNLLSFKNNQGTDTWHWWLNSSNALSLAQTYYNDSRITFNTSGNVGIGTINPECKLHVQTPFEPINTVAKFITSGSGLSQILVGNSIQLAELGSNPGYGYVGSYNINDFGIRIGGVPQLYIKSNTGFIGLGSTTPAFKLDVQANAEATAACFRTITGNEANIWVHNGISAVDLGLNNLGGYVGTITAGDFRIRTNEAVRMYFSSTSGYVGIGTENPTEQLMVSGNIDLTGNIIVEAPTNATLQNGWVIYNSLFGTPQYSKDKQGRVLMSGLAGHTPTLGGVVFTLPVGYRPAKSMYFLAASDHPSGFNKVLINAETGEVSVSTTSSNITWVSFDNVTFLGN